ncbi:hypothetical protein B0J11DRAFT_433981 [Dendryphion nanum]|uniref:Uncharacterized protein n=1 Tax=Dendryphion nanum TaxID=256645 RepID=A0A9P9DU59_9PLEO|nr:hypothetical protein B0J11DRAFT_433981 [Dendryphion nanum]
MSKNKQKKLARNAAAAASGVLRANKILSAPPSISKPRPAKRPAEATAESSTNKPDSSAPKNDTSITSIPYSSEGPTLPIIGVEAALFDGISQLESTTNPPHTEASLPPRKKRKTNCVTGNKTGGGMVKLTPTTTFTGPLAPLAEPWTLLPTSLRTGLYTHLAVSTSDAASTHIVPVVFTRNQNIRSGINKLRAHLESSRTRNDTGKGSRKEETTKIISVSAVGDGTQKVVSVVDIVRRVVGESAGENQQLKVGDDSGKKWWMYTTLSSFLIPRKRKPPSKLKSNPAAAANHNPEKEEENEEDEEEEDQAFETAAQVRQREREEKKVSVPVLTVWFSEKRVARWGDVVGEETFWVRDMDAGTGTKTGTEKKE